MAAWVILLVSACTTTTVYQPVNYEAFNQQTVLFYQPPVEPPLAESLHTLLMDQVRQGLQASPHLAKVLTVADVNALNDATTLGQYQLFGATLSDTGISDPGLSGTLARRMKAALITSLQVYHLPCQVCEEGDQLWLVGQTVRGNTGELLMRVHIKNPVSSDASQLDVELGAMVADYLTRFNEAARPKWHRLRFNNMKAQAAKPS